MLNWWSGWSSCKCQNSMDSSRNFCRFLTTPTSCLKTAEIKPSAILWGLCWKTAEISAVFQQPQPVVWKRQKTNHQQLCGDFVGKRPKFRPFSNNWVSAVFQQPKMFRSFSNKQVSAVFQKIFSAVFHIPLCYTKTIGGRQLVQTCLLGRKEISFG